MAEEVKFQKVNGKSLDIEAVDKEKLKKIFPQCFNEGKLDINKLLSLCGEYIDNDYEKYKFEWKGKSECYRIAGKRSTGTLRPCPEESVDFENTNNLYIEGDNLEVLKLLQTAYYRKVKMIYIDPPYNTGNDFVYEDDFKDPLAKYKEITSQTTKSNPETMGRYHTNWLNMMYPRLRLAANLLRDDGVIFISIDDNEVTNLRRLCDEVFGEENFVAQIVWQKKYAATNDSKSFSTTHDYVVVYQKSDSFNRNLLPRTEEQNKPYKNNDNDGRGLWRSDNLLVKSFSESGVYPIINPNTGEEFYPPKGSCWRASQETMKQWLGENRIYFGKDGKGAPQLKRYLNEVQQGRVPVTWWPFEEVGHNDAANKEIQLLFGGKAPFDTPKPTKLIEQMLKIGSDKGAIILDFFSGSATTAHAVMQLNAEDGGNRQFIMVQLPELTDEKSEAFKAGYKNICEIGKERIRRAGAKIKEEYLKNHLALTGHSSTGGEQFPSQGGVAAQADGVVKSRNTQNYLSLPYNAELTERAKELRKAGNLSEVLLWNQIKNKQFKGLDFDRQKIIGNYIVDFYCASLGVVIEIDGYSHDSKADYDHIREDYLKSLGLTVIHILDSDVKKNIEEVMMMLKNHVSLTTPPNGTPPQEGNGIGTGAPEGRENIPDFGFKVLKLDTSNLVKWDDTPTDSEEDLFNRMDGMVKSLKNDRSELDVVFEVMLKLGIPPTYKVNEISVNGRKVYSIGDDGLVLICLDSANGGIAPEDISAMCDLAPAKIVAAEEAFKDDIALSNAYYISKDKGIEIELL